MEYFFGINEGGVPHLGMHARILVQTAKRVGVDALSLLYAGQACAFTEWMERQGISVVFTQPRITSSLREAARRGLYSLDMLGHWLRSEVCFMSGGDAFATYVDCDTVFLQKPALDAVRPDVFACAPEFDPDNWSYVNTGVMVMNKAALREDYFRFSECALKKIFFAGDRYLNDQIVYNELYRGKWERLDLVHNWKPYWGFNAAASILHFHGPKLGSIRSLATGTWPWDTDHRRQIGSLFVANLASYAASIQRVLDIVAPVADEEAAYLASVLKGVTAFDPFPYAESIDLAFTKHRMFGV